jgi:cyclopropane-fatty-acyl-phospholipid synthase
MSARRGPAATRTPSATTGSRSRTQRELIESRRPANVRVLTADANRLDFELRFDRILSVEMLEHMRNYERLLARIASWLAPGGRFFRHVFSHDRYAYPYEDGWMARTFFTAGTMPSHDLLPELGRGRAALEEDWRVSRLHYARTADAWIRRFDANRAAIEGLLGPAQAAAWRVFFLACAELWGYRGGREWLVSHYRFRAAS